MNNITLDGLKSSPRLCGDFNKMREEVIREVGENQNEVDRRLTEMILPNFIMRLHVDKKNQEKEEEDSWYVIEFNVYIYSLTQLQIYININYMLMLETS
jgi:hypothetical protein